MAAVLIVDDDENFADGLAKIVRLKDHEVAVAASVEEARASLAVRAPEFVLLDLMLPDGSGLELLADLEAAAPQKIVLMTGHASITSYVSGVAGQGISYLTKPVDTQELLALLGSLSPADSSASSLHFGVLVGESAAMGEVYEKVRRVAPTDSTVFIQGESGTGKELVAEAVHRESGRSGRFIPVNCGGLTAELISSELFGHEKGSFTGAARQHHGFFERASGGTLFLDEITEMPIDMQTQLLRVLETGRFTRVGGDKEITCDTRLIAATNRNPARAVEEGRLREDLYFRLQVFPIPLPPLSRRKDDLPELAEFFLQRLNAQHGTNKVFAPDVLDALQQHSWPGNVRELKHLIARCYILSADDVIEAPEAFDDPLGATPGPAVGQSIRDVEKQLILSTLEHYGGDKKAAATTLGVSLKTLYNRLKEYEESV